MEGYPRQEDGYPQLLDLIPKDREWLTKRAEGSSHGLSEEKKLELTLGPPRGEWTYSTPSPFLENQVRKSPSPLHQQQTHNLHSSYLHLHSSGQGQIAVNKDSSQPCSNRAAAAEAENKAFSADVHSCGSAQKRTAPASVVGWPPIRSFRKNIASGTSSRLAPSKVSTPETIRENCLKSPLVKINMDGIPIGRKVDLKTYNGYEKLSLAVDKLFRGLLAAQKDGGIEGGDEGGKGIGMGGLLDGTGEYYTLVYEDNEGDRMLVGDVPWNMFVSTVKRLRVFKSSELPQLFRGSKQGKLTMYV